MNIEIAIQEYIDVVSPVHSKKGKRRQAIKYAIKKAEREENYELMDNLIVELDKI